MTTTFKLASTTIFEPRNANHIADTSAPANFRTRIAPEASSTGVIRPDTTALKLSTDLSASTVAVDATRSARIESLRQSIAAGTYSVPAHEVASAIIHSLL